MNVSDQGMAIIKRFEGYMGHRYVCPAGKLTIGYGHVIRPDDVIPKAITEVQASALLRADLETHYCPQVQALLGIIPVTQNQFDALVAFAYNVGVTALKTSTLLRKLNARDLAGAAEEFLRWDKAAGRPMDGLLRRRVAERALFIQRDGTA